MAGLPYCPRCGDPLPTADYGPVTCREWAEAAAREAGDSQPEVIAEGLELLAEKCDPDAQDGSPGR
jgi:hypothetical protein